MPPFGGSSRIELLFGGSTLLPRTMMIGPLFQGSRITEPVFEGSDHVLEDKVDLQQI